MGEMFLLASVKLLIRGKKVIALIRLLFNMGCRVWRLEDLTMFRKDGGLVAAL